MAALRYVRIIPRLRGAIENFARWAKDTFPRLFCVHLCQSLVHQRPDLEDDLLFGTLFIDCFIHAKLSFNVVSFSAPLIQKLSCLQINIKNRQSLKETHQSAKESLPSTSECSWAIFVWWNILFQAAHSTPCGGHSFCLRYPYCQARVMGVKEKDVVYCVRRYRHHSNKAIPRVAIQLFRRSNAARYPKTSW